MATDRRIDYLELPGGDLDALEAFYSAAFGWTFTDYGPEYRSFSDGALAGGFYRSSLRSTTDGGGVLVVIYGDDLEGALERVTQAGGRIVREIFSFPGGRRFHFVDPHGNELAVWSEGAPRA